MIDSYAPPRSDSETAAWISIVRRAFAMPEADVPAWMTQLGAAALRVQHTRGEVTGALALLDMGQWFGGRSVPMGGLVAVGIEPHARGSGRGKALIQSALEELAARRCALSGLFPSTPTFYRSLGYELAGLRYELFLRLKELELDGGATGAGTWVRPLTAEDVPELRRVYAERARGSAGWLDRHPYVWSRVQSWNGEERRGYAVGADKAIEGYVFLVQRRKSPGELELGVSDAVALTRRAAARILELLGQHRSMCARAQLFLGADDALVGLLAETSYELRLHMPWMLRIVDVERALGQRGYAEPLRGELELELADELLPANAGRWTLTVEGGNGRLARGGSGRLRLGVRALASLYSGFRSASALTQLGTLQGDARSLALADALFAGPSPWMPDMF